MDACSVSLELKRGHERDTTSSGFLLGCRPTRRTRLTDMFARAAVQCCPDSRVAQSSPYFAMLSEPLLRSWASRLSILLVSWLCLPHASRKFTQAARKLTAVLLQLLERREGRNLSGFRFLARSYQGSSGVCPQSCCLGHGCCMSMLVAPGLSQTVQVWKGRRDPRTTSN